jgi:hypothetical protein
MSGPGYFLLERDMVQFLEELDIPGVRFEPATVWHRRTNEEFSTYMNLHVERFFDFYSMKELDLSGLKFFTLNDIYLFASPGLKRRLELSPFEYLRFTEGMSGFA